MPHENPRTDHRFLPPGYRSERLGPLRMLAAILLGIVLLAGPPILGAFLHGSFDVPEPFALTQENSDR